MRNGPADLYAGAADRGAVGDAVLLVSGSRRYQAGRLDQDPGRDDRALSAAIRRGDHREKESTHGGWLPAPHHAAGLCSTRRSVKPFRISTAVRYPLV